MFSANGWCSSKSGHYFVCVFFLNRAKDAKSSHRHPFILSTWNVHVTQCMTFYPFMSDFWYALNSAMHLPAYLLIKRKNLL